MRPLLMLTLALILLPAAHSFEILGSSIYTDHTGTLMLGSIQIYYTEEGQAKKQALSFDEMRRAGTLEVHGSYSETREAWVAGNEAKLRITLNVSRSGDTLRVALIPRMVVARTPVRAQIEILLPGAAGDALLLPDGRVVENTLDSGDGSWETLYTSLSGGTGCTAIYGSGGVQLTTQPVPLTIEAYDVGAVWRGLRLTFPLDSPLVLYLSPAVSQQGNLTCKHPQIEASPQQEAKTRVSSSPAFRGNAVLHIKSENAEKFNIDIYKQDLNIYDGEDTVNITLIYPDGTREEYFIPDDGYPGKPGIAGPVQKKRIITGGLAGIYTLIIRGGGDTVIRRVSTTAEAVVVETPLLLYSTQRVYFWVGNTSSFSVSWKNPWKPQKLVIHSGIKKREITLEKTAGWQNHTIEPGQGERNRAWYIQPSGALQLRFQGVAGYLSLSMHDLFDPLSVPEAQIPPLRGPHRLYFTTPVAGTLNIYKTDLNCYPGADTLNLSLKTPGGRYLSYRIGDDGYDGGGCIKTRVQKLSIPLPEAGGVYVLGLSATGDVIVSGIAPPQGARAVIDAGTYFPYTPQRAYLKPDSETLNISWKNPWEEQHLTLRYGGVVLENLSLSKTGGSWRTATLHIPPNFRHRILALEVSGPVRLRLGGADYLAFSRGAWFNPAEWKSNTTGIFVRGKELVFYVRAEAPGARLTIGKLDLNAYDGEDVLNITLLSPSGDIYRLSMPDDGISNASGERGMLINRTVELGERGVYALVAYGNGDSVVSIRVHGGSTVYVGQIMPYTTSPLYFNATEGERVVIRATTRWRDTLPNTLTVYSPSGDAVAELTLKRAGVWEELTLNITRSGVWVISPRKSPYILGVEGTLPVLAFSRDELFNPFSQPPDSGTGASAAAVSAILLTGGVLLWISRQRR